jgi:subtilisin
MLIRALQVGVIALAGALTLPSAPDNVSGDPKGKKPPEVHLDEREMTPERIVPERKAKDDGDAVDWSVSQMKSEAAWARGYTGKGVVVAVLDTGIDKDHKDLADALIDARDFTGSRTGTTDVVGHGTHCAGSIAARKNGWGLQGVAYESKLLVGKVLGDSGSGGVDGIAAGIEWAVANGAKVISMSLGGGGSDPYIPEALKKAEAAGVLVIVAAGNDGNGRPVNFPAAYPFCVAVSAVDKDKRLANFSCTGSKIEVCGPGVGVRSTYPGNRFADMSGTSMATPNVAGAATVWTQWADEAKVPQKDRPAKFREWLKLDAEDLGSKGRDSSFGYGLPDLSKLPKGDVQPPPVTPPVPTPGDEVKLGWDDLTDAAKKRLIEAGYADFDLRLKRKAKAAAPKITVEEAEKRVLEKGETLIVAVGVPLDLAKYPGGFELDAKAEDLSLAPGVYKLGPKLLIGIEKLE